MELLKSRFNQGRRSNLFFWRSHIGHEIDLIIERGGKLMPVEIKSGQTFASDWLHGLDKWLAFPKNDALKPSLIYGGEEHWMEGAVQIVPWRQIDLLASNI